MSHQFNFNTFEGVQFALDNYRFIRPSEIRNSIKGVPSVKQHAYIPHKLVEGFPLYVNVELITLPDSTNTSPEGVISVNVGPDDVKPYFTQVTDFVIKKGLCSNLAESIFANLRHRMEYGLNFKNREQLYKWTFLELANNYVGRIKARTEYCNTQLFPDNASIDRFRSLFQAFIEDRNLYTHGQIAILRNTNSLCIQNYDRKALKVRYYDIQDAHFSHFSLVFAIIDSCMRLNGEAAQKRVHPK